MPQQFILILAYDGTRFSGFQRQHANNNNDNNKNKTIRSFPTNIEGMKKRPRIDSTTGRPLPLVVSTTTTNNNNKKNVTVQECLELAILLWIDQEQKQKQKQQKQQQKNNPATAPSSWSLEELNLRVAGRTDKGVHARGQVVAIQLPETLLNVLNNNNKSSSSSSSSEEFNSNELLWKIQKGIHGRLPIDISIQRVIAVDPSTKPLFDPRSNAKQKQYSYTIKYQRRPRPRRRRSSNNNRQTNNIDDGGGEGEGEGGENSNNNNGGDNDNNTDTTTTTTKMRKKGLGPTYFRMALEDSPCLWLCHYLLEDELMKQACDKLSGTHDYSAFVHKDSRNLQDNTLTVTRFDMEILKEYQPPSLYYNNNNNDNKNLLQKDEEQQDDDDDDDDEPQIVLARFYVEGERFRRTMVRNLVGFVVDVGRGYQPLNCIDNLWTLDPKEAGAKIPAAPASGLCLEYVKF